MQLLIIDGWPASGKTTMWSMLDGHDRVYVEPLHSYFYEVIFKLFDDEHQEKKIDIRTLRKCLATTEYYKYELYASLGNFEMTAGKNAKLAFPFVFDFQKFDMTISRTITDRDAPLTAASLLKLMLTCYFDCINVEHKPAYFASMSNYFYYKINNYHKFPSIVKVIQIQRDASEIYASRLGRRSRKIDGENDLDYAPTRKKLSKEAEIEEAMTFDEFNRRRAELYSEQYLQISLVDLIYNKDKTLSRICTFLDIEFKSILLDGSRDGIRFESESFQLTKNINDKTANLLNKSSRVELILRKLAYRIHRTPVNIFSIYSMVRFIYFKSKGFR